MTAPRLTARYRVEQQLGEGGMARVYLALDTANGAQVALKQLTLDSPTARAQFRREYAALAKLQHPRVIRVFEYGTNDDGLPYYTMERVEGEDLMALSPQPWRRACEILRDVCTSLALLHAQRLVHRDVSPRNVRLDHEGRAKLLDFGGLAPFGVPSEIVGTPACIAPEALRRAPLDARADLFALGAVAYWLLTQRTPFDIRTLEDAESAWSTPPVRPSAFVADVPRALDELVTSLLSIDPNGRPGSTPEVLDRLSGIASLDDAPLLGVAESHISSAALVGRDLELAKLREALALALQSHGTSIAIQGERGAGKTRLLRELTLEAQLAGFTTLCVSGGEHATNDALCAELMSALQRRAQTTSLEPPARPDEYAHERTIRAQARVATVTAQAAERTPVLLAIDDADALEPAAAGLLPMLARAAIDRTLVIAVARSKNATSAGLELLTTMGESLRLDALELASIEQLVLSTFGDVPHRARLSSWLLQASHGNPGRLRRALNALLERRAIQYVGAAWMLPSSLADEPLPAHEGAGTLTLAALPGEERRLLSLLLAHDRPLSRDVCAQLLPAGVLARVLPRLEHEGLVRTEGASISFLHPQLRGELALSAMEQQALHAQLARALEASQPAALAALAEQRPQALTEAELVRAVEVGEHRLLAGEGQHALPLLNAAAIELTKRGEGLPLAVPALERAVRLCREQGRDRTEYAALLTALTLAGTYLDWRLSYRYGDELLNTLADYGGMNLAVRLKRTLGARLALYLALAFAFLRFLFVPSLRFTATFSELLLGLIGLGTSEVGVCAVLQDDERARTIVDKLAGLEQFPPGHPAREINRYQRALLEQAKGDYASAHAQASSVLAYVQSVRGHKGLPEQGRAQLEAGILILMGQLDACRTDGSAERTLRMLERVTTSTSRQTLAATRVAYHCHRGERAEYLRWHRRVDLVAAEHGATWRNDVQLPRWLWSTHMLCSDVVTLKREYEQLRVLAAGVPTVAKLRDVLHASYLCERGTPAEALERHQAVLASALSERGLRAAQQLGAYARILRRAGEYDEAVRVCEQTLAKLTPAEREFPLLIFMLEREWPLALAQKGEVDPAREMLDALVQAQDGHDNPMLHGLAHAARAELAALERDAAAFDRHLRATRTWFDLTAHPTLFAECQRLSSVMRGERAPSPSEYAGSMDADTELIDDT